MDKEEYIKKHIVICHAKKQKRQCAISHYKHQVRKGFPIDPLRSYKND